MLSARRTASALMATIVFATLAACDTAETGPGPIFDTGPPGSEISDEVEATLGPKITAKFAITGAVTLRGTTTTDAPSGGPGSLKTCAEYAKGTAEKQFLAPGEFDELINNRAIDLNMRVADFTGPGTYSKDRLIGSTSRPTIAIDDTIYGTWADDAASEATTDGKGGGSWTFTKLANRREGSSPGDAISGTVSWTCRERGTS